MSSSNFNITEDFVKVIENIFSLSNGAIAFRQYTEQHEDRFNISYTAIQPIGGQVREGVKAYVLELKKHRKLKSFVDLMVDIKGNLPDLREYKNKLDEFIELNQGGNDIWKSSTFNLFLLHYNNKDFPFIGRCVFKDQIKRVVDNGRIGQLNLLINGIEGVGVSYLYNYLAQLDRHFSCFEKIVRVDCEKHLAKKEEIPIHPVHVVDHLLLELGIKNPDWIDVENASKFKQRYFSILLRLITEQKKDETKPTVIFIDHLHLKKEERDIKLFFGSFLEGLMNSSKPFILILGGITSEELDISSQAIELTLDPLSIEELDNFFNDLYLLLSKNHEDYFSSVSKQEFIESARGVIAGFLSRIEMNSSAEIQNVSPRVKETQMAVHVWYDEVLKDLNSEIVDHE